LKLHIIPALLICAALLAPAAQAEEIVELNRIVAVVNDDVITRTELERRLQSVQQRLAQSDTPLPPQDVLREQVLERLIIERIQLETAARTGVRVDDETVNQVVANIAADNNLTLDQFRQVLERDGVSFARFREEIRNDITINRLRQSQVDNRVTVTPQEVDHFLETQRQRGDADTEYRLAHILIAVPEGSGPETIRVKQERAEEVLALLDDGADFRQTAAAWSDGQQALSGGDLGWRKAGEIPTRFIDIVGALEPGEHSRLIRSTSGFHILKLQEKRGETRRMVRQTHARHILIKTDEITSDFEARNRLERLRERIRSGDSFAELARSHSDDPGSAAQGGDLGWANPGTYAPAFEEAMEALEPGEISAPFRSRFGWHIVQVLERRDHDNTEEFLRTRAQRALHQRKADEEAEAWVRRLRDEAYVEYRLE